jgi:hypothetical protein
MEKKDTKKGKTKPVVKKEVKKVAKVIKKPIIEPLNTTEIAAEFENVENEVTPTINMTITDDSPMIKTNFEKWGRVDEDEDDEKGIESSLTCKIDEIIRYLNSIESELMDLNTAPKAELLEISNSNSADELSWETLFMLQKQAGDTIQRNNYPEGKYSPEMLNAQRMFEKVSAKIKEKTNALSWD